MSNTADTKYDKGGLNSKESYGIEDVEKDTKFEEQKHKLLKAKARTSHTELDVANVLRKVAEANNRTAKANAQSTATEYQSRKESIDGVWNSQINKTLQWIKVSFLVLLLFMSICVASLGLYYFYRFVTEDPIIKTVTETVTKTIEKEVIPEECTQVRRNGKIYVSCDGVTVQGASTLADSGVEDIPELIKE